MAAPFTTRDLSPTGLRNLLHPLRRRHVVFCHADDLDLVADACRTFRAEGYEIAERTHRYMVPGIAVVLDPAEFAHRPTPSDRGDD